MDSTDAPPASPVGPDPRPLHAGGAAPTLVLRRGRLPPMPFGASSGLAELPTGYGPRRAKQTMGCSTQGYQGATWLLLTPPLADAFVALVGFKPSTNTPEEGRGMGGLPSHMHMDKASANLELRPSPTTGWLRRRTRISG